MSDELLRVAKSIRFYLFWILTVLIALFLSGCASGPTLSYSSGLGYARPSVGVVAQDGGEAGRVEARVVSVEKNDGGEGWALSAHALLDVVRHTEWDFLVGVDANHQEVERYRSQRLAPRVELGYRSLSLYWIGEDRKISSVLGVRALFKGRFLVDVARVEHNQGAGSRVEVAYLWRKR